MPYSIEQRDAQLKGSHAAIRYQVSFDDAAQHIINVTMEIDAGLPNEDSITLVLPTWLPGSYKIRDFSSNVGSFRAEHRTGRALPHEWVAKNKVYIRGVKGAMRATYTYFAHERTVQHSHVTRWHAFLNPGNCLFYVEERQNEVHHVVFEHAKSTTWKHVSTALSPVSNDGKTYGALNYDILVDSPVEIGNHFVTSFVRHGATHDVAIAGVGDFDAQWIADRLPVIVDKGRAMFRGLPYDRYLFLIQLYPDVYGGLEHARSHVSLFNSEQIGDKTQVARFLSLLTHEYFHLWNVKRIRPAELGPFDYTTERYTRMLYLAEGATSYYDDLMSYRCGFMKEDEYLKALGDQHLQALAEVPGRRRTSIKESSLLTWVKLYLPSADLMNRYVSYYLKGGVMWWLLDMHIIQQSKGRKRLDDGMRALYARYERNPSIGITETEMLGLISAATGVDIRSTLRTWLDTPVELPTEKILKAFGLSLEPKKAMEANTFGDNVPYQKPAVEWFTGIVAKEEHGAVRVVRILSDSPAERAGVGAEDEILAMDGTRITTLKQWDRLSTSAQRGSSAKLLLASEGRVVGTTLRTSPSIKRMLVKGKQTKVQKKLYDFWLAR
jgi:predicted metalloprotease with PDZ domain